MKRKNILDLLTTGVLVMTKEKSNSVEEKFWSNLLRIRGANNQDTFEPFVQCSI